MKKTVIFSVLCAFFAISIYADEPKDQPKKEVKMATMELRSDAFKQGEMIPRKYTCDGDDLSPKLTWNKPPEGTKQLVLICDDPDAPRGTWDHWVIYGLPADTLGLPEGVKHGGEVKGIGIQGTNSGGIIGYNGPCPPKGPAHRYFFKLYAIDKKLDLKPGLSKKEVLKAMEGHILAQGELMGKYGR